MKRLVQLALSLSVCTVAACDGAPESIESTEQYAEIWPEAEENLGFVKVELPAADKPVDAFTIAFEHNMQGAPPGIPAVLPLTPGKPQRARKGIGHLRLQRPGETSSVIDIDIKGGQTTTIALGLLTLSYFPETAVDGLRATFGPSPQVYPPTVELVTTSGAIDVRRLTHAFDGTATTYAVALPGDYSFGVGAPFGSVDRKTVRLSQGGEELVQLNRPIPNIVPPGRVRFVMPARALPTSPVNVASGDGRCFTPRAEDTLIINAKHGRIGNSTVVGLFQYDDPTSLCWNGSPFQATRMDRENFVQKALRITGTSELVMYPLYANDPFDASFYGGAEYKFVLNPFFAIDVAPVSNQTQEIRVERIDVHDILVTRNDGSTFYDHGVYRVYRRENGQYNAVGFSPGQPFSFQTNTGIDVPAGTYRVEVECVSADCTQHLQTHDLNLE